MITSTKEYIHSLSGEGQEWMIEFHTYMSEHHKKIQPVMFRQIPMFKIGKSYLMFSAAKHHFSLHTLNFDLLQNLKEQLSNKSTGKGCINIKYKDKEAIPALKIFCDDIIQINQSEQAPAVDVAPEMSNEEHLQHVFSRSKEIWRPLYETFYATAQKQLPKFHEFFPATDVVWKHETTFLRFKFTKKSIQVEFYSDQQHDHRGAIKFLRTSAKRVLHTIEITSIYEFDQVIPWVEESYHLTNK